MLDPIFVVLPKRAFVTAFSRSNERTMINFMKGIGGHSGVRVFGCSARHRTNANNGNLVL